MPNVPKEDNVEGVRISKELIINTPMGIEWRDSNLFLIQPGGCAIKVVRAADASDVAVFGLMGKGPDEFLTPCFIRDEANDSTFTILDVTQRKIAAYKTVKTGDSLKFDAVYRREQPATNGDILYTRPIRMRNGYYVAQMVVGDGTANGLVLLDSAWQPVRTFCSPLPEITKNKSHFQGPLVSKGDTLFYAGLNMPYLAAYKITDRGEITTLWEQFLTQPFYEITPENSVRWIKDQHKCGIYDLRVTDKYLIGSYSGKTWNLDSIMLPESLLVFDLNGNPVKKINYNYTHGRFTLAPDGKTTYAITYPELQIVRYDLGSVL